MVRLVGIGTASVPRNRLIANTEMIAAPTRRALCGS